MSCTTGTGIAALLTLVLTAVCDPGLFGGQAHTPIHWARLLDEIRAGQCAVAGAGASGGAGASPSPWSQSFMTWEDFASHARSCGFDGPGADVALRCAASFLDVVGAVVYKGRTCAGQVVPTLANVHSLFGVDDYVVLRPQVLIDAFKRVVTVTVPDLPSEAERRGVRGEKWCDVCERSLSGWFVTSRFCGNCHRWLCDAHAKVQMRRWNAALRADTNQWICDRCVGVVSSVASRSYVPAEMSMGGESGVLNMLELCL